MLGAAVVGIAGSKASPLYIPPIPLEPLGESRGFLVLVLWPMLYGQAVLLSGY